MAVHSANSALFLWNKSRSIFKFRKIKTRQELLLIHYNGIIWANKQGEKMTFMIRKRLLPRRRGDSRHYGMPDAAKTVRGTPSFPNSPQAVRTSLAKIEGEPLVSKETAAESGNRPDRKSHQHAEQVIPLGQ
jgi:hypothetical protein